MEDIKKERLEDSLRNNYCTNRSGILCQPDHFRLVGHQEPTRSKVWVWQTLVLVLTLPDTLLQALPLLGSVSRSHCFPANCPMTQSHCAATCFSQCRCAQRYASHCLARLCSSFMSFGKLGHVWSQEDNLYITLDSEGTFVNLDIKDLYQVSPRVVPNKQK